MSAQTVAAKEGGAIAVVMMRKEDDPYSDSPPTARIYEQNGDDFRVTPLPVLGATFLVGDQLQDFLELSTTVNSSYYCFVR